MTAPPGDVTSFGTLLGPAGAADLFTYTYVTFLGRGGYGATWAVRREADGQLFAAKILSIQQPTDNQSAQQGAASPGTTLARVRAEIENLERVSDHFGCTRLYDHALIDGHALLILEYCNAGCLHKEIARMKRLGQGGFHEDLAKLVLLQILFALNRLHRMGMIHRDVKADNVLLTTSGLVKVCDFGLSATVEYAQTFCGTATHLAPEVWERQSYGRAADVWSLGITMYHLLCLQLPFSSRQYDVIRRQVCAGDYIRLSERDPRYSPEFLDLCERMLTPDHTQRPTVLDLLRDPVMLHVVNQWPELLANSPSVPPAMREDIISCLVRDEVLARDPVVDGAYFAGPVLTHHQPPSLPIAALPPPPPQAVGDLDGGPAAGRGECDGEEHFAMNAEAASEALQRHSQQESRLDAAAAKEAEDRPPPALGGGVLPVPVPAPAAVAPATQTPVVAAAKKRGTVWRPARRGAASPNDDASTATNGRRWEPRGLVMHEQTLALYPLEPHAVDDLVLECVDHFRDGRGGDTTPATSKFMSLRSVVQIFAMPAESAPLVAIGVDPAKAAAASEGDAVDDAAESMFPIRMVQRDSRYFDFAVNNQDDRDEWLQLIQLELERSGSGGGIATSQQPEQLQ